MMFTINLAAPPRPPRRVPRWLLGAGAAALLLVAGLGEWSYALITHADRARGDLAEATRTVQALTRDAEPPRVRRALLRQLLAAETPASRVLETLRSVTPEDVWLTSVTARASGVAFEGYTFSYPSVERFMAALRDSGTVRHITLSTSRRETIADRDVLNFRITGDLVAAHPTPSQTGVAP